MDTNFHMLRELLKKYHPAQRGFMILEENKLIKDTLHIEEMDVLQLRNLRDFTTVYISKSEKMDDTKKNAKIENLKKEYTLTFSEVLLSEQNDVAINTIPFDYINNRIAK